MMLGNLQIEYPGSNCGDVSKETGAALVRNWNTRNWDNKTS